MDYGFSAGKRALRAELRVLEGRLGCGIRKVGSGERWGRKSAKRSVLDYGGVDPSVILSAHGVPPADEVSCDLNPLYLEEDDPDIFYRGFDSP